MKTKLRYIVALLLATALAASAGPKYELYVDGVLYQAPFVLERGLPHFPVDVLSRATGIGVASFSEKSIRLSGSPVDFTPVVRDGRPYLPAEAFALASGSKVETDRTRGLVMYRRPGVEGPNTTALGSGAQSGLQYDDQGIEAPVGAPPQPGPPPVPGMQETLAEALKTTAEATYAERYIRHKLYWANQIDPVNAPALQRGLIPTPPPVPGHPWGIVRP